MNSVLACFLMSAEPVVAHASGAQSQLPQSIQAGEHIAAGDLGPAGKLMTQNRQLERLESLAQVGR